MLFLDLDGLVKLVSKVKNPDHAFECACAVDACKRAIKEVEEMWQQAMLKYIKKHGPIEMKMGKDSVKYYAGHKKETKCTDAGVAFKLLDKKGGEKVVMKALSSQAFKPAHCKVVLGEKRWKKCFRTKRVKKLDVEGNVVKILKKLDSRFN